MTGFLETRPALHRKVCRSIGLRGVLFATALMAAGCGVGHGNGEASGRLFVLNCSSKGDYCDSTGYCGTENAPSAFDLAPSFFAGEPIENLNRDSSGNAWTGTDNRINRVTIRLQRSGRQVESNDTLFIDVLNSFEVARCVRGREERQPDGSRVPDYDPAYCYRASPTGPARVRISVLKGIIHASLNPRATCSRPTVATADDVFNPDGDVAPVADGAFRSWVEFEEFGDAGQDAIPDPADRTAISKDFKIGLNQRLHATAFSLELVDEKVEKARTKFEPEPKADIGGSLAGWFDFNLARGQGAQIFP